MAVFFNNSYAISADLRSTIELLGHIPSFPVPVTFQLISQSTQTSLECDMSYLYMLVFVPGVVSISSSLYSVYHVARFAFAVCPYCPQYQTGSYLKVIPALFYKRTLAIALLYEDTFALTVTLYQRCICLKAARCPSRVGF